MESGFSFWCNFGSMSYVTHYSGAQCFDPKEKKEENT